MLSLFLNTKIEDFGIIGAFGDFCLSPVRYFFQGRTVRIIEENPVKTVHHVQSYTVEKDWSSTCFTLSSEEKRLLKTVGMVIFFIPGLFLGVIVKSLSYLDPKVREKTRLAKRHFESLSYLLVEISNEDLQKILIEEDSPSEQYYELDWQKRVNPLNQEVEIVELKGFLSYQITSVAKMIPKPKKIILNGVKFRYTERKSNSLSRWLLLNCDASDGIKLRKTRVVPKIVRSIEEAKNDSIKAEYKEYVHIYYVYLDK